MHENGIFNNKVIRDWFFESFIRSDNYPNVVLLEASGPFDKKDFAQFLRSKKFGLIDDLDFFVANPTLSTVMNTVILGGDQNAWAKQKLNKLEELVDLYSGNSLKVYSQEMFLSFMAKGQDVFGGPKSLISQFGVGHYALEYLTNLGFDWPSTNVILGDGPFPDDPWPQIGLLKFMGYRVGHSGIQKAKKRRDILRKVFTSVLPNVYSPSYMSKWGNPKTSARLKKMAISIASFCKSNKRRKNPKPYALAIAHRESDLKWLYETFYRGRYTFMWPSTDVY